jgi:hypothetical protein
MNKHGLFSALILISLLGIGCVQTNPSVIDNYEHPPSLIDIVREQEVPVVEKTTTRPLTPTTTSTVLRYSGAWFDVEYPSSFTPSPSQTNGVDHINTDEATFTSEDGSVEFFIYSPLWNGQTTYHTISDNEDFVDRKEVETPGTGFDKTLTKWVTVKAKDNSYYRSYIHVRKQIDTGSEYTYTFGIKFKDTNAYNTYKDAYIAFKKSLVQYGD